MHDFSDFDYIFLYNEGLCENHVYLESHHKQSFFEHLHTVGLFTSIVNDFSRLFSQVSTFSRKASGFVYITITITIIIPKYFIIFIRHYNLTIFVIFTNLFMKITLIFSSEWNNSDCKKIYCMLKWYLLIMEIIFLLRDSEVSHHRFKKELKKNVYFISATCISCFFFFYYSFSSK